MTDNSTPRPPAGTFKVGDRVRYVGQHISLAGRVDRGSVVSIREDDFPYRVAFDDVDFLVYVPAAELAQGGGDA